MSKTNKQEEPKVDFNALMRKKFGAKTVIDAANIPEKEKFSSGSLTLDKELKGGFPRGTLIELYSDPTAGKTTTAIEASASFQRTFDGPILFLDLEDVYDREYNDSLGLDSTRDNFYLMRPSTSEEAWQIMIDFAKTFEGGLIVLDSIALLLPSKDDVKDVGAPEMASAARLNSHSLKKLFPHLVKGNTTFIAINQLRTDIMAMWGDGKVTSGGACWKFYARTRLRLRKSKPDKKDIGKLQITKFTLDKATYGNEGAVAETRIVYGEGFDTAWETLVLAEEAGIVERAGSWFSYGDQKIGQGFDTVVDLFKENPEFRKEIIAKLKELDE